LPVFASVATTIAAFLPLMLLPGIVGKEPEVLAVAVVAQLLALHPPGG
jgi:multidrug efflux pump subunit AcrB